MNVMHKIIVVLLITGVAMLRAEHGADRVHFHQNIGLGGPGNYIGSGPYFAPSYSAEYEYAHRAKRCRCRKKKCSVNRYVSFWHD